MSVPQLTVRCDIVGHASPRWKSAHSERQRVEKNEDLSRFRADAFMRDFRSALTKELGKYRLKFIENVSLEGSEQPDDTVLIGSRAMGQRESLVSAGGNKSNDDPKYRRVDITVSIARSTQDEMPTKVVDRYERSTKSQFWYTSVGVSGSVTAVAGFEFFRLKLRNNKGDEARGSVVAVSGGVGAKYSVSPYSWSNEVSFMTNREVGFSDFHGTRVRYTTAGLAIGVGYSKAYLTFWGMGSDAASLHVGGFTTGLQIGMDLAEGLLVLDLVPSDVAIERYDRTEWQSVRSDWMTKQKLSVYFGNAQSTLDSNQLGQIKTFAASVARDVRTN
jgi:hypothetical protein